MSDTLSVPMSKVILDWMNAFYGPKLKNRGPDIPLWMSLSNNSKGKPLSITSLEEISRRRLGVHFHALRHTFARIMEDQGAKVSDIQSRLGHESLQTTGRYLAALRRSDNPYADVFDNLLG